MRYKEKITQRNAIQAPVDVGGQMSICLPWTEGLWLL